MDRDLIHIYTGVIATYRAWFMCGGPAKSGTENDYYNNKCWEVRMYLPPRARQNQNDLLIWFIGASEEEKKICIDVMWDTMMYGHSVINQGA